MKCNKQNIEANHKGLIEIKKQLMFILIKIGYFDKISIIKLRPLTIRNQFFFFEHKFCIL